MWCVLLLSQGGDWCWDAEKVFGPYADKQDAIQLARCIAQKISKPNCCNYKNQIRVFNMHSDLDDENDPFVSIDNDEDHFWYEAKPL